MKKKCLKFLLSLSLLFLAHIKNGQTVTILNETFSSNSFTTNGWTFPNGQPYWSVNTFYTPTAGVAPNALFFPPTTPTVSNYNVPLVSGILNATSISGVIYFSSAVRLQGFNTQASGTEFMDIEYKSVGSTTWTPIITYTNNLLGQNQNYNLSNFILSGMSGQNFQIRFVARGANTYNIAGWGLDNIVVTAVNCPASLPSITLSSSASSICAGSSVTLSSLGGGPTFTWSPNNLNTPTIVVTPTTTTSYALISSFPGCTTSPVNAITTITVFSNPSTLSVSSSTSTICAGNTVTLSASGSGTYTWTPSTVSSSLIVTPSISTIYTVTSTNSLNCSNTNTVSIMVNATPTLGVFSSNSVVCIGSSANLIASGANTYTWSNGSNGAIIVVTPTSNTVYTVTGTSSVGCSSTGTTSVNVSPGINIISTATLICSSSQVTLNAIGANTYTWSNSSNSSSISVTPSVNTTYSVQATDNNGCISSNSIQLTVDINPTVIVNNSNPTVCSGNSISLNVFGAANYTWSNFSNNNYIIVSPTINTIYTVTGTSQTGCSGPSSTMSITVFVNPNPTLTVSGPSSPVCSGSTVSLIAYGANSYSWSSGGNMSSENISPYSTSVYTVTGTNSLLCSSQATLLVTVLPSPTIQISASSTSLCSGSSATLLATGASYYQWNTGSTVNVVSISPSITTIYSVTGADFNNCTSTKTIEIRVNEYPVIIVTSNDSIICNGETTNLNAIGAISYSWSNGAVDPIISISPSITTTYTIEGNNYGCKAYTTFTQPVNECTNINKLDNFEDYYVVYPNPSEGLYNVNINKNKPNIIIEVYNSINQIILIKRLDTGNNCINLESFSNGVYYFKLIEINKSSVRKVLKYR